MLDENLQIETIHESRILAPHTQTSYIKFKSVGISACYLPAYFSDIAMRQPFSKDRPCSNSAVRHANIQYSSRVMSHVHTQHA